MLDASWLPDVRRELYNDENECYGHIKNDTFEERPFVDYFIHWDQYIEIILNDPTVKDIYDARLLPQIAKYYNEHTNTYYRYDEKTGKKTTATPNYSSSSNSSSESSSKRDDDFERFKKYTIYGTAAALLLIVLRSCSQAEQIDEKEVFIDNEKRIEFHDEKNSPYKTEETINPLDYPIKRKVLR